VGGRFGGRVPAKEAKFKGDIVGTGIRLCTQRAQMNHSLNTGVISPNSIHNSEQQCI